MLKVFWSTNNCNVFIEPFTHYFFFTNLSNKIIFYFIHLIKPKFKVLYISGWNFLSIFHENGHLDFILKIIGLYFKNICYDVFLVYKFLIAFGMYSTPKLSKYVTLLPFYIQSFSLSSYWFILFITNVSSFILGKTFCEEAPLNVCSFW